MDGKSMFYYRTRYFVRFSGIDNPRKHQHKGNNEMIQNTSASNEKSEGYYSEYIQDRKPSDFGNKLISNWHGKMLDYVVRKNQLTPKQSFLEIGPGHGQFAAR